MKFEYHGISFHQCPIEVRERLALSSEQQDKLLRRFAMAPAITEALILCTCNRVELYLYAKKAFDSRTFIANQISRICPDAVNAWETHRKEQIGTECIRHLFSVAAGLDSQMIGENQIVNQLKAAYTQSIERRMSKFFFHRLLHTAFSTAKAVRTQTNINCGAVSISLAAVERARTQLNLSGADVLLVGAGENAALAAKYLAKQPLNSLTIASRTMESARNLAGQYRRARPILLDEIEPLLSRVDLAICSTASEKPVITLERAGTYLQLRSRPLLLIDIAVPRDVEPEIGDLPQVDLLNIDHLNDQIERNRMQRENEVPKAKAIVDEHTDRFVHWLDSLETADVIASLTRKYIDYARQEAKRYERDFAEADRDKLSCFAESLARKILHGPIRFLKSSGDEDLSSRQLQAVDLVCRMLLEDDRQGSES